MEPKKRSIDVVIEQYNQRQMRSAKKRSAKKKSLKKQSTYSISKVFGTKDISEKYEYGLSDW